MPTNSVDPAALAAAAHRLDAAAGMLAALHARLGVPQFDAAAAGRAHASVGAEVRAAVDLLVGGLAQWAAAAAEMAAALNVAALRYDSAENAAAGALR
jgi:hypothetical protein